jgi:Tol biopolymer transport system component/DNA-binding winged helix-turn-helix (wHTH) protein
MHNPVKQLLEFGPFRMDPERRLLWRGQEPIPLSPKAFDLLLVLTQRGGQVVLKDDLMKMLWPDTFVEESNLGQHVFLLRKALGERPQDHTYIVTVPGKGYRFAQTVRILPEEDTILVASHTRSRIVIDRGTIDEKTIDQKTIDEKIAADFIQRAPDAGLFPARELTALPGEMSSPAWRRRTIAGFVAAGALAGAVAVLAFVHPEPMPRVGRTVQLTHSGRVEPYSRAVTDGPRVFFTERAGGTWNLAQVAEQGGPSTMIDTSVDHPELQDIDRVHGRLLVASLDERNSGSPLWIVPASGGSGQRVGDLLVDSAVWSPDGKRIAYSRRTDLFVAGDDGSQPRKLLTASGFVEYPRWSPDGNTLSFTVLDFATSTHSVWETAADGSNPHRLSFGWKAPISRLGEGECCGDWSPDGRYFLFRSSRDGVESIWIFKNKKAWFERSQIAPVQLYAIPNRLNEPKFSADGRKIFFIDYREKRELVRYDSQKGTFVPYLGGIPARHISFSRDGQWVAYKSELDSSLWRSRIDGSQALRLTFPPFDVLHSTWSPDGKKIAFEANARLYVIPFEGGNPEQVLPDDVGASQPSWSPDGKSMLFNRGGNDHSSIWLLDLNSRHFEMIPDSETFESAHWSPDGKYAAACDHKDQKLMMFDFGTRKWEELSDGPPYGWGIRWSSDSKYVYYQHLSGDDQPIFRVRIGDRKIEQITSSRQILRADVLSYSMTGLTPDNSPLASFTHTNSDVHALELDLP